MQTISLEDVIASNPRFKSLDVNKVREYYEAVLRARNPTVLPEVVVKTKSVKAKAKEARAALKAKMQKEALVDMQNRLSLEDAFKFDSNKFNRDLDNKITAANIDRYESMPARNAAYNAYINDPQFIHHRNLEAADAQVRRTAFSDNKTLNLIMNAMTPSQQVGAIRDGEGLRGYWESLRNGNSGFVTEEYAKRHPYLTGVLNFGGDLIIGGGLYKALNPKNIIKGKNNIINTTSQVRRNTNKYFEVGQPIKITDYISPKELDNIIEFNTKDVAPRLRNALSDEGYILLDEERNLINKNIIDDIVNNNKLIVGEAETGGVAGRVLEDGTIKIPMNKINNNKLPKDEILVHEIEHLQRMLLESVEGKDIIENRFMNQKRFGRTFPTQIRNLNSDYKTGRIYTNKEKQILEDAYKFSEEYIKNNKISPILEKGATNRQYRYKLYKRAKEKNIDIDTYIDNLSDEELIKELKNVNAYGEDFYKQLIRDNENIPGNKTINIDKVKIIADNIRRSLKYVGGITPIIHILNSKEK